MIWFQASMVSRRHSHSISIEPSSAHILSSTHHAAPHNGDAYDEMAAIEIYSHVVDKTRPVTSPTPSPSAAIPIDAPVLRRSPGSVPWNSLCLARQVTAQGVDDTRPVTFGDDSLDSLDSLVFGDLRRSIHGVAAGRRGGRGCSRGRRDCSRRSGTGRGGRRRLVSNTSLRRA